MDLGLTQTIKQIQTLSPQMYMSMEILCLNSLELEDRIDKEMEENIALELAENSKSEGEAQSADTSAESGDETDAQGAATAPFEAEPRANADPFDEKVEQWDRVAREEYDDQVGPRTSFNGEKDEKLDALNNTEGRPMSLQEYLEQQVHLLPDEAIGPDRGFLLDVCLEIIYNIDDRGYLMYSLDEIYESLAQKSGAGAAAAEGGSGLPEAAPGAPREEGASLSRLPTREELGRALAIIQNLDPPGVGGRDLKECLLLQLRRDGQPYPIETKIIENHLEDLGQNRLPKIAKALEIDIEEVKAAAEAISCLNPIPGKLFGGEPTRFVRPDVVVEEIDGKYEVRVESGFLPRLQVSPYYRDLYRSASKDAELKKFVKKKLESAEWLIAAIRQRQSTLLRTAQEIVEIQKGFLDHGISHLKPLKMIEVAERVGVHVSTISRAISGKYIQTPRGIFDLKFFFTGGAVKSDGSMEARGSVIQRIKDLVDKEDKASPLSDVDIVNKLKESDITLSRRTVTKYREAENIPSSRQRRSY